MSSPSDILAAARAVPRVGPLIAGLSPVWGLLGALAILLAARVRDQSARARSRLVASVLRSLHEGVIVADRRGRVQLVNAAARSLLGIDLREVPLDDWAAACGCYLPDMTTLYPADDLPLVRALRGEDVPEIDVYVRKPAAASGTWISVSGAPLLDQENAIVGGMVIFRDITERRRSKQVVSQLFKAVEHTSDTVFITDRHGVIQFVNPAFEATTGYARDEVLGQTPRLLRSGRQSGAYYKRLWSCILEDRVFRDLVVNRKKNGDLYYADQTITPMKDDGGNVTHFVSVLKDMTEQRKRQEQEIEMQLAACIQQKLYPKDVPSLPGFDCAGAVFPAVSTCGDYYDFIPMAGGRFGVVIGDVCGHGFGPALLMAETRALLRAYCQAHPDLGAALTEVNRSLAGDLDDGSFVTLLFAAIDLTARKLAYVNAGHPSGSILDARGEIKAVLQSNGLPLGMFPDGRYVSTGEIALAPGDLVLLLTDGVTESRAADGTLFEENRVLEIVRRHRDEPARVIVERVHEGIRAFVGDQPQEDDISIVVCKVGAHALT